MALVIPPGAIPVEGPEQQARLIQQTPPVYPQAARDAGLSGTVRLFIIVGKNGTVQNIQLLSGHPLIAPAAMEAVRQWRYQPTMVNGQPVEVAAPVNIAFDITR
jgi:protein TonB